MTKLLDIVERFSSRASVKRLLMTIIAMIAGINVWGIEWFGETISTGKGFYLYNVWHKCFLSPTSPYGTDDAQYLWSFSDPTNGQISTKKGEDTYYIYVQKTTTGGNASIRKTQASPTILSSTNTAGAYVFMHEKSSGVGQGKKYFNLESRTQITAANNTGEQNDWLLISAVQYENHMAMAAYEAANEIAYSNYTTEGYDIPPATWTAITSVPDYNITDYRNIYEATGLASVPSWFFTVNKASEISAHTEVLNRWNETMEGVIYSSQPEATINTSSAKEYSWSNISDTRYAGVLRFYAKTSTDYSINLHVVELDENGIQRQGFDHKFDLSTDYQLFSCELDRETKGLRFYREGKTGDRLIKDIKVYSDIYIEREKELIVLPSNVPFAESFANIDVDYSLCGFGENDSYADIWRHMFVEITGTNRSDFSVSSTATCWNSTNKRYENINGKGGTLPLKISCVSSTAGLKTATISIYNAARITSFEVEYTCVGVNVAVPADAMEIGEMSESQGVYRWKKEAENSDWNNPNNWWVYYSGGGNQGAFATSTYPCAASDVIIPADATTFPKATADSYCKNVYLESGACIGDQFLLNYEKAFVDVTIDANRYVRLCPPLQNTYSGDFFTKEQCNGQWGTFEAASYADAINGTEATGGKNRTVRGTYQSLYARQEVTINAYREEEVKFQQDDWAAPYNTLGHLYANGEAIDVWVDCEEDDAKATFHFPAGDEDYYYYNQLGTKIDLSEQTPRSSSTSRFVYDAKNTQAGYVDFQYTREEENSNPIFAIGNPAQSYLSIYKFLERNVEDKYLAPFLYKHNNATANQNSHGTETIYYFNKAAGCLYTVGDDELSYSGTTIVTPTSITPLDANVPEAFLAPSEGFRVIAGPTKIYSVEPKLIGNYTNTPDKKNIAQYHYYGVDFRKQLEYIGGGISVLKEGHAGGSVSELTRNFEFSITAVEGHPDKVLLGNFVGRGYVEATINTREKTLTIPCGSAICALSTNSGWENVDNGETLNIIGCDDEFLNFGTSEDDFRYEFWGLSGVGNEAGYTWKVTNANSDIVLDYEIDQANGVSTIIARKPFVLYTEVFKNATLADLKSSGNEIVAYRNYDRDDTPMSPLHINEECEAFFVYDKFVVKKENNTAEEAFIMPQTEGTFQGYTDDVKSGTNSTVQNNVLFNISISRINGNYDHVLIDGLFAGQTGHPIVGQISIEEGETYLKIQPGQLVYKGEDLASSYFIYYPSYESNLNGQMIVLKWSEETVNGETTQKWTSCNYNAVTSNSIQISHQYVHPADDKGGFFLASSGNANLCVFQRSFSASGVPPEDLRFSNSTKDLNVYYSPGMFFANKSDYPTLAPARDARQVTSTNNIASVVASASNQIVSALLVKDAASHNGFSIYEDAPLFNAEASSLCLGTIADAQLLGVNSFHELDTIPLFLSSSASVTFYNMSTFGSDIVLYDAVDNLTYPLGDSTTLALSVIGGEEAGRYYICRASNSTENATGLENVQNNWMPIAYVPAKGTIVLNTRLSDEVDAMLYSPSGLLVSETKVYNSYSFTGLPTGVYLLQLDANGQERQLKVVVY